METQRIERVLKGDPVRANSLQIVPVMRLSGHVAASDVRIIGQGSLEPLGIQVISGTERYALDLEGRRTEGFEEL